MAVEGQHVLAPRVRYRGRHLLRGSRCVSTKVRLLPDCSEGTCGARVKGPGYLQLPRARTLAAAPKPRAPAAVLNFLSGGGRGEVWAPRRRGTRSREYWEIGGFGSPAMRFPAVPPRRICSSAPLRVPGVGFGLAKWEVGPSDPRASNGCESRG